MGLDHRLCLDAGYRSLLRGGKPVSPKILPDGVYINLPDSEYHEAFALSYSGIKNLRISTLDFWARSTLNTDPIFQEEEEKDHFTIGKAYDKRIIEGKQAFYDLYAPDIDPKDYPNALRTKEDLVAALIELNVPFKKSANKPELVSSLLAADPGACIWDAVAEAHTEKHDGKILLSPDLIRRIEYSAAMIEKHPDLSKAFTGGLPQVSIFWTDPELRIPMKLRCDYLKPRAIVDLKTFQNTLMIPIDRAIVRTIANNGYHIQAAQYLEGVSIGRHLVAQGKLFGECDKNFVQRLFDSDERTFMLVLQQKGIAPITVGRILPQMILDIGRMEVESAKEKFAACLEKYGYEAWVHIDEIKTYDSTEFPAYLGS